MLEVGKERNMRLWSVFLTICGKNTRIVEGLLAFLKIVFIGCATKNIEKC